MGKLTILIPGLFGPFQGVTKEDVPRFPALESLLAKAGRKRRIGSTFYTSLCHLFGLEKFPGQDLPVAALTRLLDDQERPEGIWTRIDPVHLSAGREGLTLMDATLFTLSQHDAIILGAPLKQLFAGQGWMFEIPVAKRWYLRVKEHPEITTTEINEAAGRSVQPLMPAGAGQMGWARLLNEAQMLLHDSEVNREREKRGELTINSLWLWGIGQLPEILPRKWSMLISDDPVAQGLAMLSGTPFTSLQIDAEEIIHGADNTGEVLIVIVTAQAHSSYGDFCAWRRELEDLEHHWFTPIVKALEEDRMKQLTILTNNNEFTCTRRTLLKFWRRQRRLLDYE
ncbi:MAG: hypothetical protein ACE5GZ_00570 [Gammaproteobacteria bacterium]